MIDRQMAMAQEFAKWVKSTEYFELAAPQVLPILNLRLRGDLTPETRAALHASIIEEVNRDGQRWISSATVNGQSVIRTMIISYLTEERHVNDLQNALLAACGKVVRAPSNVSPIFSSASAFTPFAAQDVPTG
jgi:Glutamate decarboxylase and related PLP-dependent proteins